MTAVPMLSEALGSRQGSLLIIIESPRSPFRGQILVNRGLLLFAKNDFVSAQENFEKAAAAAAAAVDTKHETRDEWDGESNAFFGFASFGTSWGAPRMLRAGHRFWLPVVAVLAGGLSSN